MSLRCPSCNSVSIVEYHGIKFNSSFQNLEYFLKLCKDCDLIFWYPLKIIPEFYESAILKEYEARHAGNLQIPWYVDFALRSIKDKHNNIISNKKLLDIGCGDGLISAALNNLGYKITGVELDSKSAGIARKKGIDVYTELFDLKIIEKFKNENMSFDAACFFEVLEHQDDPRQFIGNVLNVLDEYGYFFGTVPNRQRLANIIIRYLLKKNKIKHHFELPPHHFLWWSKKSLYKFLSGFPVSEINIDTIYFPYHKRMSWYKNYLKLIPLLGKYSIFTDNLSKIMAISPFGFGQHLFFYVAKN